jgi:N-carbamoylputrescine amidase
MRIEVAAVQVQSLPGRIEINHDQAIGFVEQAAARGAQLVALPELFSCGYLPNRSVWAAAEPSNGATVRWLAATAHRLGIYLGAGYAEVDGSDFFNVFVLAGPDGRIAGRIHKTNAESYVFRRTRRAHVIDTEIGRIGVGICADNQFAAHLELMHEARVDLVLMPHAWPTPLRAAGPVTEADIAAQQRRLIELPALYANALGVPVVFVNQVGPMAPLDGLLGRLMDPGIWQLRGQSRIVDSDGALVGALAHEEAALTAMVTMDPARKHYLPPPSYGGWLQPGSAPVRKLIIPLDILTGRLKYTLSRERRRQARTQIAARTATGSPRH